MKKNILHSIKKYTKNIKINLCYVKLEI
jgi:hypothetical protein